MRVLFPGSLFSDIVPVSILTLNHFLDHQTKATIFFSPPTEQIIIERRNSRAKTDTAISMADDDDDDDINDDPEIAPHTLFSTVQQENGTGAATTTHESLDIHLFFDASVLEVFVNQRVAISTRVYPARGRCFGIRPFARYGREVLAGGERARLGRWRGWEVSSSVSWA